MVHKVTKMRRVSEFADRHPSLAKFSKEGVTTPELMAQLELIQTELEEKADASGTRTDKEKYNLWHTMMQSFKNPNL